MSDEEDELEDEEDEVGFSHFQPSRKSQLNCVCRD